MSTKFVTLTMEDSHPEVVYKDFCKSGLRAR